MKIKSKISSDGYKVWYNSEGQYHRKNGPAVEGPAGDKYWFYNGLLSRKDGPAMEYNGEKSWYYKGRRFPVSSQEEFERLLNLLVFL